MIKMTPDVQKAFDLVKTLTPDTIKRDTTATYSQIIDYQAIWWNHTPTAATYFLLYHYWSNNLSFKV